PARLLRRRGPGRGGTCPVRQAAQPAEVSRHQERSGIRSAWILLEFWRSAGQRVLAREPIAGVAVRPDRCDRQAMPSLAQPPLQVETASLPALRRATAWAALALVAVPGLAAAQEVEPEAAEQQSILG